MKPVLCSLFVLAFAALVYQAAAPSSLAGPTPPKIYVPNDYATIQEAVDGAAPGSTINVRSGVYTEAIVVTTPHLFITSLGNVTINGGFYLTEDADDVTIRGFNIFPQGTPLPPSWPFGGNEFAGIYATGVTGGQSLNNTVTGKADSFEYVIDYDYSTGVTIKNNSASGVDFGIVLFFSSGSKVVGNTVTGATSGAGVLVEGDSDNNTITGNVLTGCQSGVQLGTPSLDYVAENNRVNANTCNNNVNVGIIVFNNNNSTIGPDNITNNNGLYGILVEAGATGNTVTKNWATGNGVCDLTNAGTNNTFTKNTAGCTSGV